MLYTITGADRSTGQDVTQTFDAKSPAEAESIASLTMLVSKVIAEPSDPQLALVTYATPNTSRSHRPIDWATGLERQARFLRILSWIVAGSIVIPLFFMLSQMFSSLVSWGPSMFLHDFLRELDFGRLTIAALLLSAAVIMRIIAHAALAIRELAMRNRSQSD
jgi:hypothetical protein